MKPNNNFNWKDLNSFIQYANSNCNWIVLRNFEYLPDDFHKKDKDIDILCDDLDHFVKTMKLEKRSWGISSYEAIINNQKIAIDLRFLGDDYYDKLWQFNMLKDKILTKKIFLG